MIFLLGLRGASGNSGVGLGSADRLDDLLVERAVGSFLFVPTTLRSRRGRAAPVDWVSGESGGCTCWDSRVGVWPGCTFTVRGPWAVGSADLGSWSESLSVSWSASEASEACGLCGKLSENSSQSIPSSSLS